MSSVQMVIVTTLGGWSCLAFIYWLDVGLPGTAGLRRRLALWWFCVTFNARVRKAKRRSDQSVQQAQQLMTEVHELRTTDGDWPAWRRW